MNVEAAAALVEGCGRFMLRTPGAALGARVRACVRVLLGVSLCTRVDVLLNVCHCVHTCTESLTQTNPHPRPSRRRPPPLPHTHGRAESRVRMDNLLGVMMRLRNARNLDSRQTNAVDNAYFACRPPDKAASRQRKRTPLQVGGARGAWWRCRALLAAAMPGCGAVRLGATLSQGRSLAAAHPAANWRRNRCAPGVGPPRTSAGLHAPPHLRAPGRRHHRGRAEEAHEAAVG